MPVMANIVVSTVYQSLSSNAIDCVAFVAAVSEGLRAIPGLAVIERDESREYFFVHLGFDEIGHELRAVSVVLGFRAIPETDYFLRQYTGHFSAGEESESVTILVSALHEEIKERIEQGWG
jgi:hypothetical protein